MLKKRKSANIYANQATQCMLMRYVQLSGYADPDDSYPDADPDAT